MAENEENGRFLRDRYREFLPELDGPYPYDGTFAFFAERMQRNIVSTQVLAQGMFPIGTGLKGFDNERPNLVPIQTTQDGADVLMNTPRDGPCVNALKADKKTWLAAHEAEFFAEHKELLANVSKACGYEIRPGDGKGVVMNCKGIHDAFTFAKNEGLDYTIGGRIDAATVARFSKVVGDAVHDVNFGKPHQLVYWAGDFIPEVLRLARPPLPVPVNKFHLFLNHRELLYAIAHILGLPLDFPGSGPDNFPTAASLVMEVYDHGVKLFWWTPTAVPLPLKAQYLAEGLPVRDLFSTGSFVAAAARGCEKHKVCDLRHLAGSWLRLVKQTGTYVDICNVSKQDTYFARGEVSLGYLEKWMEPDHAGIDTTPARGTQLKYDEAGLDMAAQAGVAPSVVAAWLAASVALALAGGGALGYTFGRRGRQADLNAYSAPYIVAPM